ncbi:AlpA family phage regulatory protein [Luteibacter sp. OK325]|uniref:helix-turn-helix transcriptional regulator n=1 Tax=Luteibacter sp. OK325 TaxID=2135670 RepID=UPI000D338034|nr:AlpA family phage regulatory protein [Luteibacter sp. OK325]
MNAATQPVRLLRLPEVLRTIGISRSHLYKMMSEGVFPLSIRLSARVVAWSACDVDSWILKRVASSRQ